ncbi:MAG: MBL fold metallo-hydrolase [Pseudomonadota bacterium]
MRTPLYKTRRHEPAAAEFNQNTYRVNDFIACSEGTSNVYLIETSEGNILVNTGMGFESPVHQHNLEQFSNAPIKYVISTQGHVDHLGGVQYFRDLNPGLTYIAQSNNQEHQAYDARLSPFRASRSSFRFMDDFMEVFQRYADNGYTALNGQDQPTPDVTFDATHEFTLGGLDVQLIAVPGAETNDSLIIWLPQHRIVFTGNLFGCPFGHFPNLVTVRGDRYRDALTCADAAQAVLDLNSELLIYGHHESVEGADLIRNELTAYKHAIEYVHDEVVRGMNDGKSIAELQQEIRIPDEYEVGQGYGKLNWSIRAIWEHYAGWFKHESTTELYNVPQHSIYADLIELAGVDALVTRAEDKFTAKQYEDALHLLDIVRHESPDHAGAIDLAIRVHEQLLRDAETFCTTGNFWLTGWLEHTIKTLNGKQTGTLSIK